jgi:hypothetical protein
MAFPAVNSRDVLIKEETFEVMNNKKTALRLVVLFELAAQPSAQGLVRQIDSGYPVR